IKKVIQEQVKKEVSNITPKIEKLVNEQLEFEVLVRSSKEAKTSHAVAANLSRTLRWNRPGVQKKKETMQSTDVFEAPAHQEFETGPTFELMKGTCKSLTKLEYFCEEVYKVTTEKLDWINPKGRQAASTLLQLRRPRLQIMGILNEGDVHRLRGYKYIVRLLLLASARKVDKSQHETLSHQLRSRGFIYENKDKKNRLMRIDELHKFSDGTLDDVRTALNDCLKGIRMEYLPQTFWSQRDKANARFNTTAGNPVKRILLKLNLSDHRLFKDGGGGS
ncbi:hypothetical protein Tco_0841444, partial [Tanacetum coccineum]